DMTRALRRTCLWQPHGDGRAFSQPARDLDVAAVRLDDAARDREPEAEPAVAPRRDPAEIRVEDARQDLGRDSRPLLAGNQHRLGGLVAKLEADRLARSALGGVVEGVDHHPFDADAA